MVRVAVAALLLGRALAQLLYAPVSEPEAPLLLDSRAPLPSDEPAHVVGPHTVCQDDAPQYSGRIPAGSGASYFFWLATARRAREAPLILWLTGGPGCASSIALLFENGPCRPQEGPPSSGPWPTQRNAYSWNEAAHVVWVDQPAGVGYSTGTPAATERTVAERMLFFLRGFYAQFPALLEQPLFIFGESYAGHYVPAAAWRVQQAYGEAPFIKLGGIAIGNGLVNPEPQLRSMATMAYTGGEADGGSLHGGAVSQEEYERMRDSWPECKQLIRSCQAQAGSEQGQKVCLDAYMNCNMPTMGYMMLHHKNMYDLRKPCETPMCYNLSTTMDFVQDPEVQRRLGVPEGSSWVFCNKTVQVGFVLSGDWMARVDGDVTALLESGVPVLVYNGDCDFSVNWLGSKAWVQELNWTGRATWNSLPDDDFVSSEDSSAAGRVRSFGGLTFLQLFDAGHMVPMDQPAASLAMVRRFIRQDSDWHSQQAVLDEAPLWHSLRWPVAPSSLALVLCAALGIALRRAWWMRSRAEMAEPLL